MKVLLTTTLLLTTLVLVQPRSSFAWTHCGTPQAEKDCPDYVSPTPRGSHKPMPSPSATVSATPTSSPSESPTNTPEPTPGIRTDLSDNKSDGKGCSVRDCSNQSNGQSQSNTTSSEPRKELPTTGGGIEYTYLAGLIAGFGLILRGIAGRIA